MEPGNGHLRDAYLAQHSIKTYLIIDPRTSKRTFSGGGGGGGSGSPNDPFAIDSISISGSIAPCGGGAERKLSQTSLLTVAPAGEFPATAAQSLTNGHSNPIQQNHAHFPPSKPRLREGSKRFGKWTECGASGWAVDKPFSSISESVIAKNVTQTSISQIEAVLAPPPTSSSSSTFGLCDNSFSWLCCCGDGNAPHSYHQPASELYPLIGRFKSGSLEAQFEAVLFLAHFPPNVLALSGAFLVMALGQLVLLPV